MALQTGQSGYTGTGYLQPLPDIDALYQTNEIMSSPRVDYPIYFTTPGTYTLWLRGYPPNAAGDSLYIGLNGVITTVTGFGPGAWGWGSETTSSQPFRVVVTSTELYMVSLWMREDGLRIDRLLLTTDTNYLPNGFGPAESLRLSEPQFVTATITRTIVYTYDGLYRLTGAGYSTGDQYAYEYDPVGNRLQQIINGDTTSYQYDAANRLEQVDGQNYSHDDNGNLLNTGVMTNSFDAANRLVSSEREGTTVQPIYNGIGDRVGQTVGTTTTHFALDIRGLPEVIHTSEGEMYLHLPGVIIAEKEGEVRYLLSDGLGSIRQATDETGEVVAYNEYDPYGNPLQEGSQPYGFTGEWWQEQLELLHLRARWYAPQIGRFLSRDPLFTMAEYGYASNNPVNRVDPSGYVDWDSCVIHNINVATCHLEFNDQIWPIAREVLDNQGVPNAWDEANEYVNSRIATVMEPRMWELNPHLHPPGVAPYTNVGLWHCPACRDNPTISAEAPYGTINLPPSWLPGGGAAPPLPPTPVPPGPTPTPPLGDPNADLPPLPDKPTPEPGGLWEIAEAIITSHAQEDDGIVFGGAYAINHIAAILGSSALASYLPEFEANGACLPRTGYTTGLELVYDFKHQERGIFWYQGSVFNIGSFGNAGFTGYVGTTRGFASQSNPDDPDGYKEGVKYYSGYFAAGDANVGPGVFGVPSPGMSIGAIEAAPLLNPTESNPYKKINPQGVFATYYSVGAGVGSNYLTFPPGTGGGASWNLDAAVTNYTILNDGFPGRVYYGIPFLDRRNIFQRIVGAKVMETEIRMLGGQGMPGMQTGGQLLASTNVIGQKTNEAITQLWDFVYRP